MTASEAGKRKAHKRGLLEWQRTAQVFPHNRTANLTKAEAAKTYQPSGLALKDRLTETL